MENLLIAAVPSPWALEHAAVLTPPLGTARIVQARRLRPAAATQAARTKPRRAPRSLPHLPRLGSAHPDPPNDPQLQQAAHCPMSRHTDLGYTQATATRNRNLTSGKPRQKQKGGNMGTEVLQAMWPHAAPSPSHNAACAVLAPASLVPAFQIYLKKKKSFEKLICIQSPGKFSRELNETHGND